MNRRGLFRSALGALVAGAFARPAAMAAPAIRGIEARLPDGFECRLTFYGQLAVAQPRYNMIIKGLDDWTPGVVDDDPFFGVNRDHPSAVLGG